MLENVQGFLTSHKGADVAYTVDSFNSLGYVVDLVELDASHFTPQSRPRVFLFAVREDIAPTVMELKEPGFQILDGWWSIFDANPVLRTKKVRDLVKKYADLKWGAFKLPLPKLRESTLSDIVEKELHSDANAWWSEERKQHLYSQMSELHKAVLKKMISGSSITYGTVYRRTRNGVSCAELRTDGVAGCLRTPRGGSSKQILISAGNGDWAVRLLTPREYARLQGVADTFKLPSNPNKGYFAMGDAVCVPAISFLAEHILDKVHRAALKKQPHISNKTNPDN